jgi:S-adenosylmethionine hydrolase
VGPDNGVLSAAFGFAMREAASAGGSKVSARGIDVHELDSPQYKLPDPSATFHGRDVFAPAAAHLANGVDHRLFGPPVGEVVAFPPFTGRPGAMGELNGYVVHVDRYGNLITTVRAAELFPNFELTVGGVTIGTRVRTFANVAAGEILCHVDSSGFIAVAVNRGSAAETTGIRRGDAVLVRCQ